MKVKPLIAIKSKFFKSCSKLQQIFKFRFKRTKFTPISSTPSCNRKTDIQKQEPSSFISSHFPLETKAVRRHDEVGELKSTTEVCRERVLFSSPLTPAYIRSSWAGKEEALIHDDDVVEDACRSFENFLVEMIVEEGRVRDLMDVEELIYCWKNLKCPMFIELVCRFYGELCKDLFSGEDYTQLSMMYSYVPCARSLLR